MANESRPRRSRPPATPSNTATTGVILVIAAVVIAVLLFNAGGGTAKGSDPDQTAADAAKGASASTTTSTLPPVATTPPAALVVVVANGSGVPGRAKVTAEKLATVGYTTTKAVDGTSSPTTIVYFSPDHDADAALLVQTMGLPVDRIQPIPEPSPLKKPDATANLILLVGADFDPATATFATPTTAPTN